MRELVRSDLRSSWRIWIGAFIVLAVTQCVSSWMGGVTVLALSNLDLGAVTAGFQAVQQEPDLGLDDPRLRAVVAVGLLNAVSIAGVLLALVMINTIGNVASLIVNQRRRLIALWQLSGMTDRQVRAVVGRQFVVVGVLASLVGAGVGAPTLPAVIDYIATEGMPIGWMDRTWAWSGLGVGLLFGLVVIVIGARRSSRAIADVAPLEVMQSLGVREVAMTPVRALIAVLMSAVGVFLMVSAGGADGQPTGSPGDAGGPVMLGMLLVALALAVAGPGLFPWLTRRWTALVPARVSVSWHLARHALLAATGRLVTSVGSVLLAVILVGGSLSVDRTTSVALRQAPSAESTFGIVVLVGLPMVVVATGSVVMVLMAGQQREKEIALGSLAGATPRQQVLQALFEAVIALVTGAVPGLLVVLVGLFWLKDSFLPYGGDSAYVVAVVPLVLMLVILFVANATASVLPTVLAMRRQSARLVAVG